LVATPFQPLELVCRHIFSFSNGSIIPSTTDKLLGERGGEGF